VLFLNLTDACEHERTTMALHRNTQLKVTNRSVDNMK